RSLLGGGDNATARRRTNEHAAGSPRNQPPSKHVGLVIRRRPFTGGPLQCHTTQVMGWPHWWGKHGSIPWLLGWCAVQPGDKGVASPCGFESRPVHQRSAAQRTRGFTAAPSVIARCALVASCSPFLGRREVEVRRHVPALSADRQVNRRAVLVLASHGPADHRVQA